MPNDDLSAPVAPALFRYCELNDQASSGESPLAAETALAISYNGINHAVMMVSPGHLDDFVRGFSLSNAIAESPDDIYGLELSGDDQACRAEVEISSRAMWALKESRRQLAGVSGCGICGVEALEQALPELRVLQPAPLPAAEAFQGLRDKVAASQHGASVSGALHAALYVGPKGDVQICREDIGRHNALDKLIGALTQTSLNPREGLVVVTSRCSVELIIKAVRAGLGTLATLSAPTGATVEMALRYNLNLVHIPHYSPPRRYSPAP